MCIRDSNKTFARRDDVDYRGSCYIGLQQEKCDISLLNRQDDLLLWIRFVTLWYCYCAQYTVIVHCAQYTRITQDRTHLNMLRYSLSSREISANSNDIGLQAHMSLRVCVYTYTYFTYVKVSEPLVFCEVFFDFKNKTPRQERRYAPPKLV